MIELAFLICLAADPAVCRTERVQFVDVSLMTCMTGAQAHIALWSGNHPGWTVRDWRCRYHDPTSAEL